MRATIKATATWQNVDYEITIIGDSFSMTAAGQPVDKTKLPVEVRALFLRDLHETVRTFLKNVPGT